MNIPLANLTTVQASAVIGTASLAILPLGAIEQHGPHLALRTDISIATALAARIADALGDTALLLPPMPYGLSEHHTAFAGTVTLRPDTLIRLILDVVESMSAQGIDRVIIVNGHGGNIDAIRLASRQARRDSGSRVAHVMWAQVAADAISQEMSGRGMYNHACEIETSLAMDLCPEIVHPPLPGSWLEPEFAPHAAPPTARIDVPLWFDELTPTGALGDPSRATQERGRLLADLVVERTVAFARAFVAPSFPLAAPTEVVG
ncbi:creatininase family protein [Microbacterium resistens]